jgi:hypothetical protein
MVLWTMSNDHLEDSYIHLVKFSVLFHTSNESIWPLVLYNWAFSARLYLHCGERHRWFL